MRLPYAEAFSAHSNGKAAPSPELENELRTIAAAGRSAWPGVSLEGTFFAGDLAHRTRGDETALRSIRAGDVYLACACMHGDRAALRAFDREYLSRIPDYLRTMRSPPDFVDDVRQVLSERLLVGSAETSAKLGEYSGRGPLGAWIRVAALRTALNLLHERKEAPEERGAAVVERLEGRATLNGITFATGMARRTWRPSGARAAPSATSND
jgi:RNA polymerase sigma-70 factor